MSLAGWSAGDPTPLHPGTGRVENYCGPLGATLADILYGLLGWGAWVVVAPIGLSLWSLAGRSLWAPTRWMGAGGLYFVGLGLTQLALRPGGAFPPGGWVGAVMVTLLEGTAGTVGSVLVLVGAGTVSLTLVARIDWGAVARRGVDAVESAVPVVLGWFAQGGRWTGRMAWGAGRAGLSLGFRGARGAGLGGLNVARRMVASVRNREGDEVEWETSSELARIAAEPDTLPPSDLDDRTVVANQVVLAEVEWDPTTHGPPTDEAQVLGLFPAFSARQPVRVAEGAARPAERPARRRADDIPVFVPEPELSARVGAAHTEAPAPRAEASAPRVEAPAARSAVRSQPAPARPEAKVAAVPARAEAPAAAVVIALPAPAPSIARPATPRISRSVDVEPESELDEDYLDDEDEEDLDEDEDFDEDDEDFDEEDFDEDDEDLDDDEDFDEDEDEDEEVDEDAAPPVRGKPVSASPRAASRPAPVANGGSTTAVPPDSDDIPVHRAAFLDEKVQVVEEALARKVEWALPPVGLLDTVPYQEASFDEIELRHLALTVEEKLQSFKIGGKVTGVRPGPVVTVFEFLPDPGIKVSRIAALSDDIAMAMKARAVRIEAPIPGRGVVGIEIPSAVRLTIFLREVLSSTQFRENRMALPCVLGKDIEGKPIVADLAKMPHLLVGGTTGSGKSVGVNGMLMSLLYTRTPDEMRMLLVDPKMLEFELYEGIPHLLHPVITEPKKAQAALEWACREMDDRYRMLARWGTRNIVSYNKKVEAELVDWTPRKARQYAPADWPVEKLYPTPKKLPYIVIVIDELADLMMVGGKEVEESIVRIAQKARACGIHLIVATQRPSVDVVTGLIKANLPTRIAYQLRTKTDSRTVLDQGGAETLLGQGDLLYLPPGTGNLQRCHGAFVSDEEVARVMAFLRDLAAPEYIADFEEPDEGGGPAVDDDDDDPMYEQALEIVMQAGKASTSMVQRHLKIGYNRAARIIDIMEARGVVGPADGARPREVLR